MLRSTGGSLFANSHARTTVGRGGAQRGWAHSSLHPVPAKWWFYLATQMFAFGYSFSMYDHRLGWIMRVMGFIGIFLCVKRISKFRADRPTGQDSGFRNL